ncbi:MAG: MurR/RpiR family transcriptional regulator [Eubacteriales bacterium]
MSDILTKISDEFNSFTHSQKAVANYVIENTNTLAFCTLDDFAMQIGVSTTTVIRFARTLGYSGYSDMQKDIQNLIKDKVSLPERLNSTVTTSEDQLLSDTFNNDINDISSTFAGLSKSDLHQAIEMILSANNIYLLGLRSSFSLSYYMASRLGQIRKNVHLIQSVGMDFPEEIIGAQEDDICIGFMFPRYSKHTANILSWFKSKNVRIILVTSQNWISVKNYGDIILPCCVNSISFKNSFVAPMCLINYIAAAVAMDDFSGAMEVLKQTEEILSKGYYLGL